MTTEHDKRTNITPEISGIADQIHAARARKRQAEEEITEAIAALGKAIAAEYGVRIGDVIENRGKRYQVTHFEGSITTVIEPRIMNARIYGRPLKKDGTVSVKPATWISSTISGDYTVEVQS